MKTRLLMVALVLMASVANLSAQYCGSSGSTTCTPNGTITVAGDFNTENLPCIVRGQFNNATLQFKNYDFFTFNGVNIIINSLRIDSIEGLPSGICWSTNKTDNTFMNQEDGCISFKGTTLAPVGQYKLKLLMTWNTNIGVIGPHLDAETVGMRMFLRVKNTSTSICPPIDTNQTSPYDPGSNIDSLIYVSGLVYHDANSNGVQDNGELGLRNIRVNVGNVPALTNAHGNYGVYTVPGVYTVTPQGIESGGISFPGGSTNLNATTAGQEYSGNNFATIISPSYCEAMVSMVNTSMPPRPGFDNIIRLSVTNTLSQSPQTFTIRFKYDNAYQTFVSSSALPAASGVGYIDYNVSNLAMGDVWATNVELNSSTTTPLSTPYLYTTQIIESSCASILNQVTTQEILVVGSYDPNDKAVSPIGRSDHHGINPNNVQQLTYKIRFQNTGTFLAEKVVIVDTISQHLNISTLSVQSASHDYEVEMSDDRSVKFIFDQIMLPDSTSDEPGSHGYVQYTIKLNEGLTQNTVITNKADIYFDFNTPIRTNTAYNTIDYNITGIEKVSSAPTFSIFPNPTTGNVQIAVEEQLIGKELSIRDISGRLLLQRIVDAPLLTIPLTDLANGVYLIQIDGTTEKLVKE